MARKFPTLWQGSPEDCIILSSPAPLLGNLFSENIGKREVLAAEDLLDFSQCRRLLAVCKTVQGRFGDPELSGKAGITLLAAQSFQEVRKCLVQTGHFPSLARFSFRMWMIFHIRSMRVPGPLGPTAWRSMERMQCAASFGRADLLKEEEAGEMPLISPLPQEILPLLFKKRLVRPKMLWKTVGQQNSCSSTNWRSKAIFPGNPEPPSRFPTRQKSTRAE